MTPGPNPVRIAIAQLLKNDAMLKELATGVFHRKAPRDAKPPYVIFSKSAGNPLWAFAGPAMDKEIWLVKGVGQRKPAEEIDRRCKELLDGATLKLKGKTHQDLRHMGDVDYDEIHEGERFDHVGAEYKVDSEND